MRPEYVYNYGSTSYIQIEDSIPESNSYRLGVNYCFIYGQKDYAKLILREGSGCTEGLSCDMAAYLTVYKYANCTNLNERHSVFQLFNAPNIGEIIVKFDMIAQGVLTFGWIEETARFIRVGLKGNIWEFIGLGFCVKTNCATLFATVFTCPMLSQTGANINNHFLMLRE
jgi:hypothetical protein